MSLVDHNHVVQALASNSTDDPFRDRVRSWGSSRRTHARDLQLSQLLVEVTAIIAVAIVDEELRQPTELVASTTCRQIQAAVWLAGPDRAANFLEIVVIERDDGTELAIHAMKMRSRYAVLLPPGDRK